MCTCLFAFFFLLLLLFWLFWLFLFWFCMGANNLSGITEYLRLRDDSVNRAVQKVLGFLMRGREVDQKFTGTFYYLVGVIICLLCYSEEVATISIIFLS